MTAHGSDPNCELTDLALLLTEQEYELETRILIGELLEVARFYCAEFCIHNLFILHSRRLYWVHVFLDCLDCLGFKLAEFELNHMSNDTWFHVVTFRFTAGRSYTLAKWKS